MFCLVRTSRDGRPQQGITFLLLDMDTPGITVRPIPSIADDHDFNQVFFEDARVPVSGRLGEEDQGWSVAKYLLEFERAVAHSAGLKAALADLVRHARGLSDGAGGVVLDTPAIRRRIAILAAQIAAIEASEDVVMAQVARGRNPGPAASMLKIQGTETAQQVQELAVELAGDYAAVSQFAARQPGSNEAPIGPAIALTAVPRYFNGRAASIYGGSNEIQRNIIAKMVLGL
jgi:acyl-CoA dehydrogenase